MDIPSTMVIISAGVACLVVLGMVISIYQRCPPNQAMIVYGGMGTRIIKSGGSPVWPMIEQRSYLSLEVMTIEVRPNAPLITKRGVPVIVEGAALVKVMGDEGSIMIAAEQFLGKSDQEMMTLIHQILIGHLLSVLSTMEVEQLKQINLITTKVQEHSIPDLLKLGMTVVSFTIKDIKIDHKLVAEGESAANKDELSELRHTIRSLELRVAELEAKAGLQR